MNQEFLAQEKKRLERIEKNESRLQMINFLIVAAVGSCGYWFIALGIAFFSLYSWIFYLNGKESNIIDEIDTPSVPDGIRGMLKSWFWLVVVLYVVWLFSPTQ